MQSDTSAKQIAFGDGNDDVTSSVNNIYHELVDQFIITKYCLNMALEPRGWMVAHDLCTIVYLYFDLISA